MPRLRLIRQDWRTGAQWLASLATPGTDTPVLTADQWKSIKRVIVTILVAIGLFFVLTWIFWESPWLRFWLQAFTGNWSPENSDHVGGFQFALSVLLGIMLNWLPLLAAIALFFRFVKPVFRTAIQEKERIAVNMTKALTVRTATEKMAVLSSLPDDKELKEKVDKAFEAAAVRWKDQLRSMIGDQQAAEVFTAMEKEIPSTDGEYPARPAFKK